MTKSEIWGWTFGIFGTGASIFFLGQTLGVCKKVDMAVGELANCTHVDIEKTMVEKAVNKAAERETQTVVSDVTRELITEMKDTCQSRVRTLVDTAYTGMESTVSEKLAKQVANIDENKLRQDVSERAKVAIMAKMSGRVDSILNEFQSNLRDSTQYASPSTPEISTWTNRPHAKDERCMFDGMLWENTVNGNVSKPGSWGWKVIGYSSSLSMANEYE